MTYSKQCQNEVVIDTRKDGSDITVRCGKYCGGRKVLCDPCEVVAEELFPQGWVGYPGDTCKHGVYVGGCGRDLMCMRCEFGDGDLDDEQTMFDGSVFMTEEETAEAYLNSPFPLQPVDL